MNYHGSSHSELTVGRVAIYASVACVIGLVLLVVVRLALPGSEESADADDAKPAVATDASDPSAEQQQPTADDAQQSAVALLQRDMEQAQHKAALIAFQSRSDEVARNHLALVAELQAFNQQMESLLTNEEGKRLATSERSIGVYQSLAKKPRLTDAKLKALKAELDALVGPVLKATAADLSAPIRLPDGYAAKVEVIAAQIDGPLEQLRQDQQVIRAMLAATDNSSLATKILSTAIAEQDAKKLADLAEKISAAEAAERKKTEEELVQGEIDKAIAEREAALAAQKREEARIREEEKIARALAEAEKAARAAQAAKAELEREMTRQMPKIRSVLSPFISQATSQVHPRGIGFAPTLEAVPVSYGSLQGVGALDPTLKGLDRLLLLGNVTNNERPRGGFPGPYKSLAISSKPDVRAAVKEAQDLLIKFGPLLVEQELLAP